MADAHDCGVFVAGTGANEEPGGRRDGGGAQDGGSAPAELAVRAGGLAARAAAGSTPPRGRRWQAW